ncbi:MAG: M20/M25/M40 family metallo-hydrolase [Acidobacteria bacterium]|nr:M20/M25/M40 family metallo-hydrolase [Acidobacteriota bacterium]
MRRLIPSLLVTSALVAGALAQPSAQSAPPATWLDAYREPASRLIGAALADQAAFDKLAYLGDTFGPRLAGSRGLELAIEWAQAEMKREGLENVRAEPAMVPKWVRGQESLVLLDPVERPVVMLGLGNSVGTPAGGITADAIVVSSYAELEQRAAEVKGKIVVYNVPYTNYGETVQYRGGGASRAAKLGAVAALVRSVGPIGLRTPHTGAMNYDEGVAKIPAAGISAEDASILARLQARRQSTRMRLTMEAHFEPDAQSYNVIGEIRGRETPDEIVVVSGHYDSWDVGTGMMDDGGGCIAAWEAVRLMLKLHLRPRRTVRVVLYTNEENGLRGGTAYRDQHAADLAKHVAMLESDAGVFRPLGVGFSGSDQARAIIRQIATLLTGIDAHRVGPNGGGADIGPSVRAANIPSLSLDVDGSEYFTYHHTPADTIERLNPQDVAKGVATIAVMSYVIADLPERLPSAK